MFFFRLFAKQNFPFISFSHYSSSLWIPIKPLPFIPLFSLFLSPQISPFQLCAFLLYLPRTQTYTLRLLFSIPLSLAPMISIPKYHSKQFSHYHQIPLDVNLKRAIYTVLVLIVNQFLRHQKKIMWKEPQWLKRNTAFQLKASGKVNLFLLVGVCMLVLSQFARHFLTYYSSKSRLRGFWKLLSCLCIFKFPLFLMLTILL